MPTIELIVRYTISKDKTIESEELLEYWLVIEY